MGRPDVLRQNLFGGHGGAHGTDRVAAEKTLDGLAFVGAAGAAVIRFEFEAVENRRIMAGGNHHAAGRAQMFDRKGNRRRGRRLRREDDLETVAGQDFGGSSGETVGEKPAVKANDNLQFISEDCGLWTVDCGLPIICGGLGDARDVREIEILRDDCAPAVRAEFDGCHAPSLAQAPSPAKHRRLARLLSFHPGLKTNSHSFAVRIRH